MNNIKLLDCTLRDGGYYNNWDFDKDMVEKYLKAMSEVSVDYVELGLRGFSKEGFKGASAFTTDNYLKSLVIPQNIKVGVMINASDILSYDAGIEEAMKKLFSPAKESPVNLVRIACHVHEFERALTASIWLKEQGYEVGYNLMQVADRSMSEISNLAFLATQYPIDVLYFADSLGSLDSDKTLKIVQEIRKNWKGPMGIHTHDNMGLALNNSIQAINEGVTWIDGTVTGMGRGPGNSKTEYLVVELEKFRDKSINITPLLKIINEHFYPMQKKYGWGTNTYYYLAGRYGIHPTYIQEMINDSRYDENDILSVIEYLKLNGGKKYNIDNLEAAKRFYNGNPTGKWSPLKEISKREVLILGTGPGLKKHKDAIEGYIRAARPYVIALNTQDFIQPELIDIRAACHPVRLMADYKTHAKLPQPLAIPYSMVDEKIKKAFNNKEIKDYGISCESETFNFYDNYCIVPKTLVIAYALSIATSGQASHILLAGFDGYDADDSRNIEMEELISLYSSSKGSCPITAITPSRYQINKQSVYQMIGEYAK